MLILRRYFVQVLGSMAASFVVALLVAFLIWAGGKMFDQSFNYWLLARWIFGIGWGFLLAYCAILQTIIYLSLRSVSRQLKLPYWLVEQGVIQDNLLSHPDFKTWIATGDSEAFLKAQNEHDR